jgi:cytochrome c
MIARTVRTLAMVLASTPAWSGCDSSAVTLAESLTAGNVARGDRSFRRLGCGSCHHVDGDQTRLGRAGPSLDEFAWQAYLPGGQVNEPNALIRWLRFPREVAPGTAMPDLGVTEAEARDLAAYLYTLR